MNDAPTVAKRPDVPRPGPPRVHAGWIASLILLLLVIFGFQIVTTRSIGIPLAELAGRQTVNALFITIGFIVVGKFCGWLFVGRRGRSPARSPKVVTFCAIFASLFFGAVAGPRVGNRPAKAIISAIESDLARLERESAGGEGFPKRTPGAVSALPPAAGKPATIEQLLRDVFIRFEAVRNEYLAELDAIHWDSVLDPARLAHDTTLAESRLMVKQAQEIVAKQEARTAKLLIETRDQMSAMPISDVEKRGLLKGFDESRAGPELPELQKLERQIVAHIDDLVETLAASQFGVGWTIQNGEMGFLKDDDMNKYNSQIDALLDTTAKQDKLMAEKRARIKQGLSELKQ